MGRKLYKAPTTELFRVELEGTFAGSAEVTNSAVTETGRIDHQSINTGFETDFTFGDSNWD